MANGRIEIDIGVDSSEATGELATLDKALDKFGDSLNEMGGDFEQVFDDLDASAAKLSKQTGDSLDKTRGGLEKLSKGAKDTGKELSTGGLKKGTDDSIKGLDSLKGGAGEVSSSFGQFGGAIGVLSPELGGMASQMGALAGGLEGAAKMTKLTGGSMKTLAAAGGTLGVAVGVLAGAWMIANRRTEEAKALAIELAAEMRKTAQQTQDYSFAVAGLQNSIGLLGDAEFAVLDAKKKSADMTKEQTAEAEMQSRVVIMLKGDLEELNAAQLELQKFATTGKWEAIPTVPFRDLDKTIRLTTEAMEKGTPVLAEFGVSTKSLEWSVAASGGALKTVNKEIEEAERLLGIYEGKVTKTAQETERLNLMFQIQAAQARDDSEEVRKLALSLAILEDVETRLSIAALRAAKALAIHSLQLSNFGPATAAAIKGIEKMFDKLESDAPSGFAKTLSQLNTKLKTTADTTKDLNTVEEKAIDLTGRRETALDMLAKATGVQAVADRDYVKAKEEVNKLLEDGALNEKEAALLFKDATAIRVAAFKEGEAEIKAARDAALQQDFEAVQAKIANAQAMNDQISNIISASMDRRSQAIDRDEANALAAAEGNAERQEQLKAKFDARRQSELGKLFKAQQATEIATTMMSGASAGIGALAPPPTGLGPVAGIPLAILVAATTAAQVGLIASQQPAFHQGGIIGGQGDQAITAQGGEVVLNREAVAAMGGPSAAAGLNEGGGGGGVIVVQNVYKQRVFDAVIADNLAKGGPLKSALNSATRAGRRGRVGGLL
jgi:hypothetical protein